MNRSNGSLALIRGAEDSVARYCNPFGIPGNVPPAFRGYPERFRGILCIEARSASEDCAPTSGKRRFLADHASVVPASGFNVVTHLKDFRDSLSAFESSPWGKNCPFRCRSDIGGGRDGEP